MPDLTISDLDEATVGILREQAARNGSTPADEARVIIENALCKSPMPPRTLGDLRTRFLEMTEGGVDLDPYLPERQKAREIVDFDT